MQGQAGRLVVATGLLRSPDGVIGQTVWIRQGFPSARKRGLDRPNRLPRQKLSWTAKQAHEERAVLRRKNVEDKDVNVLSSRDYCPKLKIWG
jgi:hypothetical protein